MSCKLAVLLLSTAICRLSNKLIIIRIRIIIKVIIIISNYTTNKKQEDAE